MKYLLDTNIVSEARRATGHPAIRATLQELNESDLYISVITVGEIAKGIAQLNPSRRKAELMEWFAQTERFFAERIVPVDQAIAIRWGNLSAMAIRSGRTLPPVDGLLAATALERQLRLITRNTKDFLGTGVQLLNPCEP